MADEQGQSQENIPNLSNGQILENIETAPQRLEELRTTMRNAATDVMLRLRDHPDYLEMSDLVGQAFADFESMENMLDEAMSGVDEFLDRLDESRNLQESMQHMKPGSQEHAQASVDLEEIRNWVTRELKAFPELINEGNTVETAALDSISRLSQASQTAMEEVYGQTDPRSSIQPTAAAPAATPVVASDAPRVAITGSGNSVQPYDSGMAELQQALIDADPSYREMLTYTREDGTEMAADGLEGPRTRMVIENYAQEHGLNLTEMSAEQLTTHIRETQPAPAVEPEPSPDENPAVEEQATVEVAAVAGPVSVSDELAGDPNWNDDIAGVYYAAAARMEGGDLAENNFNPQAARAPTVTPQPQAGLDQDGQSVGQDAFISSMSIV